MVLCRPSGSLELGFSSPGAADPVREYRYSMPGCADWVRLFTRFWYSTRIGVLRSGLRSNSGGLHHRALGPDRVSGLIASMAARLRDAVDGTPSAGAFPAPEGLRGYSVWKS